MVEKEFPVQKSDIAYDSQKQEVTLKREKFDALIRYASSLIDELESLRATGVVERYKARRLLALRDWVRPAQTAIERWLAQPDHSILQLASRTGIPYATCHRIIRSHLPAGKIELGDLVKILDEVEPRGAEAVAAGAKETAACLLVRPLRHSRARISHRIHYSSGPAGKLPKEGEVIAVGGGRIEKGERILLDVKAGDRVLFGKYSGTEIKIEDEEYLILREEEILEKISKAGRVSKTEE